MECYRAAGVNTGATIVTLLMVFLIQNTRNRNSEAMQRADGTAREDLRSGKLDTGVPEVRSQA